MRTRLLSFSVALAIAATVLPSVAAAQNREHLQMTADLRMLQEQVSKLQLSVNQLAEQVRVAGKRADDAADATVRGFANQQLLINQIVANLRTVSEKLDDNNVRVSQFTQELPGIRQGLANVTTQLNVLVSLLQPPVNPTVDASAPGQPAETGLLSPVPQVSSPGSYFQQAEGDYFSGRYDNAIEGFRELIQKFPNSVNTADAQHYIGQAYYSQKKCALAIPEFQKVITNYKDSPLVPDAYLMQGICYQDLNQPANARKMFELVRGQYPNSTQAAQAAQKLRGMGVVVK